MLEQNNHIFRPNGEIFLQPFLSTSYEYSRVLLGYLYVKFIKIVTRLFYMEQNIQHEKGYDRAGDRDRISVKKTREILFRS